MHIIKGKMSKNNKTVVSLQKDCNTHVMLIVVANNRQNVVKVHKQTACILMDELTKQGFAWQINTLDNVCITHSNNM